MSITKQVVISQIEVVPNGTIQVRLDKQVVEDGAVLAREYHRTVLPPGIDVDAQMDLVDAHLEVLGWPALDKAERGRIKRIVTVEHTPATIKAYAKASRAEPADG